MRSGPESSAPDGKEFAEHLRTVHFSLVLAVFALLAGSLLTKSADADRALVQLRSLKDLQLEWKLDWADEEAKKIIESRPLELVGQDWLELSSKQFSLFGLIAHMSFQVGIDDNNVTVIGGSDLNMNDES